MRRERDAYVSRPKTPHAGRLKKQVTIRLGGDVTAHQNLIDLYRQDRRAIAPSPAQ
jgi:hypothetical protein